MTRGQLALDSLVQGELTQTRRRHVGFKRKIIWDTSKPNGQPRRKLDVTRVNQYFGFEAQVDFDEGPRRTIVCWEANRDGYDELNAHGLHGRNGW